MLPNHEKTEQTKTDYTLPLYEKRDNHLTGLHINRAYTNTGTSAPQCVHQFLCCLLMHICILLGNCN